ncbi:hypothetical protein M3Y99_00290600 [Aphelenchoides fujianensis]|nr:hypothetical protein M3Y99_00290600 [Aphelenchoides fujianensis]
MGLNRHYCACGIHVHHGTRVIAAVFCLVQVVSIVNWGVQLQSESARGEPHVLPPPQPFYRLGHTRFVYSAIALGMTTIIHGMLLYGNLHRQPSFYWPFIIMNVIGCIGGFVVGFMLLLFGGASAAFISQLAPITSRNDQRNERDHRRTLSATSCPRTSMAPT